MRYVSTRGQAPELGFADTVLAGLADDGGLYVPQTWPSFGHDDLLALRGKPYGEIAMAVIERFTGDDISSDALRTMIEESYATFRHPAICPLVQMDHNHFLLELFHGPTLAFKDVAMQFLARLMDHILKAKGERATIVGATSGDTGGAAVDAFAGRDSIDLFILFPEGKVSPVQRRQMTTSTAANVHAMAVKGNFDDCQQLVKAMFADAAFRDRMNLSAINSINWARIMAQSVYYFTSALSLGAPDRRVSYAVPTGNFGDIFAGFVAKRMGLDIDRLVIATNDNDILVRTLETGRHEKRQVVATSSPSMDIQISSNFERLLFEAYGRDAAAIRRIMGGLAQSGSYTLEDAPLTAIKGDFVAGRSDRARTDRTIRETLETSGYLLDPHTATAYHVASAHGTRATPMVTLATAHPAKFPDAVKKACGLDPQLPAWLSDLMDRDEKFSPLAADLDAVEAFIESKGSLGGL